MINKMLGVCLMALTLWGCEKSEENKETQPLIVILSPDNPPFEFKNTAQGGGEVQGFDVDILKEVAHRLNRPLKIVEADFGAIIPSLQSGRADLGVSELTPSEERRKSVDFSDIYYNNPAALLVIESSPLASAHDFQGKKIGAQLGTVNETLVYKWAEEVPGISVVSLGKVGELVQELKNGRLDAILVGGKVAHNIAASTGGLRVVAFPAREGGCAMAFPKGSPLRSQVNTILKDMKPEIETLAHKWMGQ